MTKTKNATPVDSSIFASRFIELKHGTSKAADTYGYTRVTATDRLTGARAVTTGGGYDLTGAVFAKWMEGHIQDRLDTLEPGAVTAGPYPRKLYGITYKGTVLDGGYTYHHASVDGGCGHSAMLEIAEACGLAIESVWGGSCRGPVHLGWMIHDTRGGVAA